MNLLARVRLDELTITAALMFFGMAGAIPGVAPNQANEMTGATATATQTLVGIGSQAIINGAIALLLLLNFRLLQRSSANLLWPCSLALWTLLSVAWSQDPLLTARRAVPFAIATGLGVLLSHRFTQRQFLSLLQVCFALLALWSAVLALSFPSIGLDASTGHGGDWQGVFTQKNACGRAMVFALCAILADRKLSLKHVAFLGFFALELGFSGSRGAWVLALVSVSALLFLKAACYFDQRSRAVLLIGGAALSILAATLLCAEFATLAPFFGRDATLTGRTAIWHEVWLSILHRPLLGYGFSAFWRGAQGASWDVVVALRFVLFHAHNGFLEIWLELGAAGLLLFTVGFVRAAVLLWPEVRAGRFEEAAWPFAVLLLVVLYNFDENTLLSFNGLFWVLYVGALTHIEILAAGRKMDSELFTQKAVNAPEVLPLFAPRFVTFHAPLIPQPRMPAPHTESRSPWL